MRTGIIATGTWAMLGVACAQDFYQNKTIELVVSTGLGSALDVNARIVARHLPNFLAGKPNIVVRNMPGGGHIRAANFLFNQAAQDGTSLGTIIPSFVLSQVLDGRDMQFDAARFQWIGSTSTGNAAIYVRADHRVKTLEDATRIPVRMGATGAGSYAALHPAVMNNILGTKFRIAAGYQSPADLVLAMRHGEIDGRAGATFASLKAENADWLRLGNFRLLAQAGLVRDPEFRQAPLISEFAKNESDREILKLFSTDVAIGRPFLTPPDVPAERIELLRKAFDAMVSDPGFLAEAKTSGLDVLPLTGAAIQNIVHDLVNSKPELVARAKAAMHMREFFDASKADEAKEATK